MSSVSTPTSASVRTGSSGGRGAGNRKAMTHKEVGMLVALATFGMLFGTLFLSYLLARERFPVWPPPGIEPLRPLLPSLSTGTLIASSLIIHRAQQLFEMNEVDRFKKLWAIGTLLGFVFLGLQTAFWSQMHGLGLLVDSHIFASIFYVMTGLHAVHILGGLFALLRVFLKVSNGKMAAPDSEGPKLAAWFWHFLDVTWILMFVLLIFY